MDHSDRQEGLEVRLVHEASEVFDPLVEALVVQLVLFGRLHVRGHERLELVAFLGLEAFDRLGFEHVVGGEHLPALVQADEVLRAERRAAQVFHGEQVPQQDADGVPGHHHEDRLR